METEDTKQKQQTLFAVNLSKTLQQLLEMIFNLLTLGVFANKNGYVPPIAKKQEPPKESPEARRLRIQKKWDMRKAKNEAKKKQEAELKQQKTMKMLTGGLDKMKTASIEVSPAPYRIQEPKKPKQLQAPKVKM